MEVSSHFEGRVRVRDEGLKKEPLLSRAREALLAMPGVSAVEANPRVGSLLVLYTAAVTALEKLLKKLSDILGSGEELGSAAEPGQASGKIPFARKIPFAGRIGERIAEKIPFAMPSVMKSRILNNIGMLASLALSLGAAFVHLKKIHVLAGIVFVALFGIHLFERRKMVFA